MKRLLSISILYFLIISGVILAQEAASKKYVYQPRNLIDMNTAGLLDRGNFSITSEQMSNGVFLLKADVGLFKEINIGISYGASSFLGNNRINLYEYPGVSVRFRIFQEEYIYPAILFGFDSQGKGEFSKDTNYQSRFEIKSPGFYIVASKNVNIFGNMGLHFGLNYSLETRDNNKNLNLITGFDKTIGSFLMVSGEYNFALNDDVNSFNRGFLNLGLRFFITEGFNIGLDFRNILSNKTDWKYIDRGFRIEFCTDIF